MNKRAQSPLFAPQAQRLWGDDHVYRCTR